MNSDNAKIGFRYMSLQVTFNSYEYLSYFTLVHYVVLLLLIYRRYLRVSLCSVLCFLTQSKTLNSAAGPQR